MMSEDDRNALTELLDRGKIRDCMMRYAQAVDRLEMVMLKSSSSQRFYVASTSVPGCRPTQSHKPFEYSSPSLNATSRIVHREAPEYIENVEPQVANTLLAKGARAAIAGR
ncbi:hypothetical protein SAMN05518849_12076 [Sphingobium sp. AP50]|uniref:hypothetical protein n=1 Tax=Sphingobium sp. AP50 TaxID=1884369 RepID=UPI0008BD1B1E|nr:hypothetical protein [Sphingobium sp. AP50]SEJ95353.1 hypothetical protein SAMN05518849_12076 [Sphingobium sp. AP50]